MTSHIIITYKTILQGLVRQCVQGRNYDVSAGQHQPSSGLLRENANLHGVFECDTDATALPLSYVVKQGRLVNCKWYNTPQKIMINLICYNMCRK